MHYVVKEGISAYLVADADSLMREFYRADEVVNNLDQNNIKTASINYDTTFDPAKSATCKRSCTRTHLDDASGILYKSLVTPTPLEDKWVRTTTSLTFNLATTTPMSIYTSGTFTSVPAGANDPLRADVAIYFNGERLGVAQCFSAAATAGDAEVPFMVAATALLPAGDCALSVGFIARCSIVPGIVGVNIAAIGYAR
jgi:hypothetical protein